MPTKYDYKDVTPNVLRRMTDTQLQEVCDFLFERSTDAVILHDMIIDRNDFRDCYFKLVTQLQDMGVKPCVDYYRIDRKGRKNYV